MSFATWEYSGQAVDFHYDPTLALLSRTRYRKSIFLTFFPWVDVGEVKCIILSSVSRAFWVTDHKFLRTLRISGDILGQSWWSNIYFWSNYHWFYSKCLWIGFGETESFFFTYMLAKNYLVCTLFQIWEIAWYWLCGLQVSIDI